MALHPRGRDREGDGSPPMQRRRQVVSFGIASRDVHLWRAPILLRFVALVSAVQSSLAVRLGGLPLPKTTARARVVAPRCLRGVLCGLCGPLRRHSCGYCAEVSRHGGISQQLPFCSSVGCSRPHLLL
ncbi:hypothetical protein BCV69DRAFT_108024 [Microstroma glucosiphilum]|uniref:Uncharacterized protein n=1 Tax=Pseudomicrostroma glucosiphilum TaxID=1684307 RepID=A0A316UD67_9BASI|nr:hypothetical protein BCV69DRAFT_108024 [Pseudomicrostroma glucosiphilum]PWN23102.1 hypothetical protein BCV69DRAFT_108024 [Pseudomicrostroma glucosiphilum]